MEHAPFQQQSAHRIDPVGAVFGRRASATLSDRAFCQYYLRFCATWNTIAQREV
jgi:hypothetical protein